MQSQYYCTGEQPQAPPFGHRNVKERSQQSVGGSGDCIAVEHILPYHSQCPLGHDVGENKNRA